MYTDKVAKFKGDFTRVAELRDKQKPLAYGRTSNDCTKCYSKFKHTRPSRCAQIRLTINVLDSTGTKYRNPCIQWITECLLGINDAY